MQDIPIQHYNLLEMDVSLFRSCVTDQKVVYYFQLCSKRTGCLQKKDQNLRVYEIHHFVVSMFSMNSSNEIIN